MSRNSVLASRRLDTAHAAFPNGAGGSTVIPREKHISIQLRGCVGGFVSFGR